MWNTVKGKQFLEVAKLPLFLTVSSIIGTQNAQRPTKSTKVSTYHINLYDTNLDEQHKGRIHYMHNKAKYLNQPCHFPFLGNDPRL